MIKMMLETIFFVSNDVVTVLQFSLKSLGRNGLSELDGDNVSVVVH